MRASTIFLIFVYALAFHTNVNAHSIEILEAQLYKELSLLNYPQSTWKESQDGILDVAIIGSGMAGISSAFALMKEGITNIQLFDQNDAGEEGPWITFARMKVLRSSKNYSGPALGISNLTFHAWYEASFGEDAWKALRSIPTRIWMDYLIWYKKVLKIPVENNCKCAALIPGDFFFELQLSNPQGIKTVYAKKVVLATGRGGFGGLEIPEVVQKVSKSFYAHTGELYDFSRLKGKRVAVIGSGASAFDAAAVALENQALKVDLLLRRTRVPYINKFVEFSHPGISRGFYHLDDQTRVKFFAYALENGIPPPKDALLRVQTYPNFKVIPNSNLESLFVDGEELSIDTGSGNQKYDFIVLGTGFSIDGSKVSVLKSFFHDILLWSDRLDLSKSNAKMGRFPYLGNHFQFLEKVPGTAPYLKHLYCFNYGAALSHGLISSDIPCISIGAERLAQGIAADFFVEEKNYFYQQLLDSNYKAFNPEDFKILNY